jgi:CheY-like chemotaxis protein
MSLDRRSGAGTMPGRSEITMKRAEELDASPGPPPAAAPGRVQLRVRPAADGPLLQLDGFRLLVVDDDHEARVTLRRVLEQCGARVSTAASATEALEQLDREVPDAVVSDIAMPGDDGYALIRMIRQRPAARGGLVPAVALTALSGVQDVEHSLAVGYQQHLSKPVRLAVLLATLIAVTLRPDARGSDQLPAQ